MIIINRALSQKRKANKKRERPKKKRTKKNKNKINKRGNVTISFSTLALQSSTMFFIQRVSYVVTFIYQWESFIIELGLCIPMMGFLKMPQVFVSKQVGCTPTSFSFVEISYICSSSASVAWQSLLLMLTSIDGHLHSPLIILVNVRLSPFLSSPHNLHHHILFHPQCYIHGSRSCIA